VSAETQGSRKPNYTVSSFSGLFTQSLIAVMYHDADGKVAAVNQAACELLGLCGDELIGKDSLNTEWRGIQPDGMESVALDYSAKVALRSGQIVQNQIIGIYHPITNQQRWISVNSVPEFREGEIKPFQVFSTLTDITEERRLRQQLSESQENFTSFLNNLDQGVWIRDFKSGQLIFVNDAIGNLYGSPKEDFFEDSSRFYEKFIHPVDRSEVLNAHKIHLETGDDHEVKWRLVRSDGQIRSVKVRMFTFTLPGTSGIVYSAGLTSDSTEAYLSSEGNQLNRLKSDEFNKLTSNLLSTISHEFRTPITGIIGFSKLLQEPVTEEERHEFARHIEKSTYKLYKTLESILDYSVLDAKKVDLSPAIISIQESVRMVLERTEILAQEKGIYFQHSFCGADNMYFYPNLLDTLLKYVLDNAVKFTVDGGIRLVSKVNEHRIQIEVHDTGRGIATDLIPFVFDPFRQGSEGVARLYEGIGMGLAIVKRILDSIQGEITLMTNDHGGSSFYLDIPLPVKQEDVSLSALADQDRQGFSVLYVENNLTMQLVVKSILKNAKIDFAKQVEQALEAVKKTQYDLILLDVNPGQIDDGIQLLRKIRETPGYTETPVVMISAYSVNQLDEVKVNLHQVQYLSKPFSEKLLKTAVRQFFPDFN
jgi:PAS domain S-box-containing protein